MARRCRLRLLSRLVKYVPRTFECVVNVLPNLLCAGVVVDIYEQVPQAHTCFNTLDLPLYGGTAEGKAKMKEVFSLILMFDAGEGIGFSRA